MAEKKATVDIRTGRLFPFPFLVLGTGFLMAGLGLFTTSIVFSAIAILVGALILTAYEGTEINPSVRTYREYNSFLFLKKGSSKKYQGIEKIFINSVKVSQRIYTARTSHSTTFTNVEYNAYLKFEEGIKLFLVSDKNKNRLLRKLSKISQTLDVPVVDNTVRNTDSAPSGVA